MDMAPAFRDEPLTSVRLEEWGTSERGAILLSQRDLHLRKLQWMHNIGLSIVACTKYNRLEPTIDIRTSKYPKCDPQPENDQISKTQYFRK